MTVQSPEQAVIEECLAAMDHLRSALDFAPARSATWYGLAALLRALAVIVDGATARQDGPPR